MKTLTGHLECTLKDSDGDTLAHDCLTASGNARQRRRKIRQLKAQGWTVYSCRRQPDRSITVVKR